MEQLAIFNGARKLFQSAELVKSDTIFIAWKSRKEMFKMQHRGKR